MRIRIVFRLKNKGAILPFHHQALIRTMLEMILGPSYPLSEKMFSYSGIKGQTKVGKDGLHYYSKRVTLVFSSSHEDLVHDLCQAIFRFPQLFLGSLILEPEIVEREELLDEAKREFKYLCISPVVLCNTTDAFMSKSFINPMEAEFSDLLYESTMTRMENSREYSAEQLSSFYKFQVVPDKTYLDRLAAGRKKFARIYTVDFEKEAREVRGYTFPLSLYASEEVQQFIFHNGFGEFTEHGFGMVDYSGNPKIKREVIYDGSAQAQNQ